MMAQIVYFKEWLIVFYKKHVDVVLPVLKLVFAFFTMCMFQGMFPYNMVINKPGIFLVLSAAQAFLPISVLYYMISILIMINLWKVSMDIFLGFVIFSIICSLAFVRVDRKHAVILNVLFKIRISSSGFAWNDCRIWGDSSSSGRSGSLFSVCLYDGCKHAAYHIIEF